ncbi:unnamed protein product [Schistosoma curassoni]|uniref:Peptidase_M3 domain-containing protein n=1 Tax=Schistosoma curassoni TaxID=6186 RepID=A0A183K4A0_9TREM|nr:unnamed protein product [Schistosoma curassoni]
MEFLENVGDWENQTNSNGNEEKQLGGSRNDQNHWTQAGQKKLDSVEMLLYSSHEEENAPYTQEVAVKLSKLARDALIGWESHRSRIIKASFITKKEGITMNVMHPPMIAMMTINISSMRGCNRS